MPITRPAAPTVDTFTAATNWNPTAWPVTPADDDVAIIYVLGSEGGRTETFTGTGWTTLHTAVVNSGTQDIRCWAHMKKIAAGEALPTISMDTSNDGFVITVIYRGVDTTTQLDVASTAVGTATGTSHVSSTVTPVTDGAMMVSVAALDAETGASPYWTEPGGYTKFVDQEQAGKEVEAGMAELLLSPPSAQTLTWTSGTSDAAVIFLLALRPVVDAATTSRSFVPIPFMK